MARNNNRSNAKPRRRIGQEIIGALEELAAVLSSGFAEQNKISSMLADGLRGFIPKPYTGERLLAQVRSTLDAGQEVAA